MRLILLILREACGHLKRLTGLAKSLNARQWKLKHAIKFSFAKVIPIYYCNSNLCSWKYFSRVFHEKAFKIMLRKQSTSTIKWQSSWPFCGFARSISNLIDCEFFQKLNCNKSSKLHLHFTLNERREKKQKNSWLKSMQ